MAITIGTYNSNSSSYTKMQVSWTALSATQIRIDTIYNLGASTGLGTGNSRALVANIYDASNNLLGTNSIEVKASTDVWNAGGTYYGSVVVTIPYQSGSALKITAYTMSTGGVVTSCLWTTTANVNYPSLFGITYPVYNTAPYWSGDESVAVTPNGIIAENITSLDLSWNEAHDAEGNTLYYDVYRITSWGGTIKIASLVTARTLTDSGITAGQQGGTISYAVYVTDGLLYGSNGAITSATITKNLLTGAIISHSGDIAWLASGKQDIAFNLSAGSNTNGTGVVYQLSIAGLTITNPTVTGNFVLSIYRSGAVPSNPYISWDDLKTYLASGNYAGILPLVITTTNTYGSTKQNINSVVANIAVAPLWATPSFVYSGGYTINSVLRYLPDVRAIGLAWTSATDDLGAGTVTYDIEIKKSTDTDWTMTHSGISAISVSDLSPTSYDVETTYNIRVRAKTVYGTSNLQTVSNIAINKYLRPLFSLASKTRTTLDIAIGLIITPRTSLPSGDYSIYEMSFTNKSGTVISLLPSTDWTPNFLHSDSGVALTQTDSYTMLCKFNDSIGNIIGGTYATALSLSISVASYIPMFSIRKKGVGVNCINDGTDNHILKVTGKINSVTDDSGYSGFYENNVRLETIGFADEVLGNPVPFITADNILLADSSALSTMMVGSGQIKFPSTANPSTDVNTLDDYEEGTWQPIVKSSGTSGTQTYSRQEGKYVKIGKQVTLTFRVTITAKASGMTGNAVIEGFPFAVNGYCGITIALVFGLTMVSGYTVNISAYGADSTIWLISLSDGSWSSIPIANLASNFDMIASATYITT